MTLSQKQRMFTRMIADLIQFAYEQGYELTFGDAYRDARAFGDFGEEKSYSAAKSVHKLRLAVDFNLWIENQLIKTSDHDAWVILHEYWSQMGGADAIPNDANHFSLEQWGVR